MTESENTLTKTTSIVKHGRRFIDRTGQKFGRLKVISFAGKKTGGQSLWNVRCDCGNVKVVSANGMVEGHTRSCGCLAMETIAKIGKLSKGVPPTHGHTSGGASREYASWMNMKNRCRNPNSEKFRIYGARGIKVCQRWLDSFENFLSDMGKKPIGLTLERINVNGDYEPSNCVWDTPKVQANNTRVNRRLTLNGTTLTLTQWSEKIGITSASLSERIESGWTLERALTEPANK